MRAGWVSERVLHAPLMWIQGCMVPYMLIQGCMVPHMWNSGLQSLTYP